MVAKSFCLSVQGSSHIKRNKECQDASSSFFDEKCAIAVVCDGHGGDDYVRSALGSRFAADVALENIKSFISTVDEAELAHNSKKLLATLEASIISAWNELVYKHFRENPFSEEELKGVSERARKKYVYDEKIESAYGTTLIAAAMTERYWFGIHIGDGKCVCIDLAGEFTQPIPWDEKCFLNATTSICDSNALNNFRSYFSTTLPAAVFIGSDGIDDCFNSDEQLNNLYKTVLYSFSTSEFQDAVSGLEDYLPRLSAKGSGDDVSIAAVLDMASIGEIEVIKNYDREKEKARLEEKNRIAAQKEELERRQREQENCAAQESAFVLCPHCGMKLPPASNYCSECGAQITLPTINESMDAQAEEDAEEAAMVSSVPEEAAEPESIEEKSAPNDMEASAADKGETQPSAAAAGNASGQDDLSFANCADVQMAETESIAEDSMAESAPAEPNDVQDRPVEQS